MRKLPLLLLACTLVACSAAPTEEDKKAAGDLAAAANQAVEDEGQQEDALDDAEAWLEAGKRRELDAYAEKKEAAPVERLRKIVTATRALEDLRAVIRKERRLAAAANASVSIYVDSGTSEDDRHRLGEDLFALRVELHANRQEKKVALERWQRARAALGVEAFGGKAK